MFQRYFYIVGVQKVRSSTLLAPTILNGQKTAISLRISRFFVFLIAVSICGKACLGMARSPNKHPNKTPAPKNTICTPAWVFDIFAYSSILPLAVFGDVWERVPKFSALRPCPILGHGLSSPHCSCRQKAPD